MIEWLAMPPPGGSKVGLDAWIAALGESARVVRRDMIWIEMPSRHLRGYVVFEGENVEAINFELSDPDAFATLDAAATALGWELHPDDGEDDE